MVLKAKLIEAYTLVRDMEPGDIAISVNRKSFFICGYILNKETMVNKKVVLDINNLSNQYTNKRADIPVRLLLPGDKFIVER